MSKVHQQGFHRSRESGSGRHDNDQTCSEHTSCPIRESNVGSSYSRLGGLTPPPGVTRTLVGSVGPKRDGRFDQEHDGPWTRPDRGGRVREGKMIIAATVQAVHESVIRAQQLAPAAPKDVNTQGIVSFFASKIAPILLAVLGVIFIGRAGKGEISKVLTSSAIAIIGLAFIAGAVSLFFVGDYLIRLAFQ
jgi:hypothetical protein